MVTGATTTGTVGRGEEAEAEGGEGGGASSSLLLAPPPQPVAAAPAAFPSSPPPGAATTSLPANRCRSLLGGSHVRIPRSPAAAALVLGAAAPRSAGRRTLRLLSPSRLVVRMYATPSGESTFRQSRSAGKAS